MPDQHEIAIGILELFKKQRARAGYVLPTALVLAWSARKGWSMAEAEQAIEYGLAKGWFAAEIRSFVRLRNAGLDEIQSGCAA